MLPFSLTRYYKIFIHRYSLLRSEHSSIHHESTERTDSPNQIGYKILKYFQTILIVRILNATTFF